MNPMQIAEWLFGPPPVSQLARPPATPVQMTPVPGTTGVRMPTPPPPGATAPVGAAEFPTPYNAEVQAETERRRMEEAQAEQARLQGRAASGSTAAQRRLDSTFFGPQMTPEVRAQIPDPSAPAVAAGDAATPAAAPDAGVSPPVVSAPTVQRTDAGAMQQGVGRPYTPDYSRAERMMQEGIPQVAQPDNQRTALMGLLGALAGFRAPPPGVRLGYGMAGMMGGAATGAAGELVRQDEDRQRTTAGRAAATREMGRTVADQENTRASLSRTDRNFDENVRQFGVSSGQTDRRIGIEQQNADTMRLYRQMQVQAQLRRLQVDQNEEGVWTRAVPMLASPNGQNLAVPPNFTVEVDGRQMSLPAARAAIADRLVRQSPTSMAIQGVAPQNIDQHMEGLIMQRIAQLRAQDPRAFRSLTETMAAAMQQRASANQRINVTGTE